METTGVIAIGIVVFLLLGVLFFKLLQNYVTESFGKKWLTLWGNKLYFWQSLLFTCLAGTALIMGLLQWIGLINL